MPSAIRYIPPTDSDRNMFGSEVEHERTTRRDKYRLALEYYKGEHPNQLEFDAGEDPDDNTVINLVQMTADRTVSFLFPSIPIFQTDPASPEDTAEEAWIKDFFDANGGLQALSKLGLRGFLSGHGYIRLKPVEKAKRSRKNVFPKMTVLDPTSVLVYWKADDVADVLWYEMRYSVGSVVYIQDFVRKDDVNEWWIYTYKSQEEEENPSDFQGNATPHGHSSVISLDLIDFGNTNFEQIGSVAIHRHEIPPIIEFPHLPHPDDYYGLGEFTQQSLQDTINRIASERNRIVRENADPVDVMTGAGADEIEDGGSIISIDSPMAKVTRLEMKGDMVGITTVLDKLIETYLAIARVVLLKGEAKDLQRVTNASVRTLFLDALSKNNLLQSTYGYGLLRLVKLALAMAFEMKALTTNPESLDVNIKFAHPLPVDETEIANQNAIMVGLGARSLRTAATKMGDNWAFETSAMDVEADKAEEQALRDGEVAAENAKKLSEAVPPAPAAPGAAKKLA